MDTAFTHLLAMLCDIADPRRAEGKLYGLPHVFLFSILAVMAGANSYRAIHSFIDVHLHRLKQTFGLNWRRAPAYTTVRGILQGVAAGDVEAVFRLHAQILNESAACQGMRVVAFDGKTLRGSFDKFTDTRPAHLVSAFEYIESAPLLYDDQDPAVSRALFCINYCFGYAVPQSDYHVSAQYAPISPQIVAAPLLAPSDLFKRASCRGALQVLE